MLRAAILILVIVWPVALLAQETPDRPAVLIADELYITADRELVASGNVEAFQGNIRLEAREIRYNRATGALDIIGPIRLDDGERITILASSADIDGDLRRGLLTGARMVLDQQLQLAAATVEKVDDRYNQLYKTSVTSCKVCEDGKPPLWQIRAKRVIHDKEEGQLYFDEARFLIRNTPIVYIPRLRLPDPTVKRTSGFLIPSIRSTSELGFGIKVPYFFVIDDHRDLTITPYVSSRTKTVELRYRQAFVNGDIELNGAVSRDDERPGETRAYLFGDGEFDLRNDFKLNFNIELTSDDAYLRDYDYSDKDRLSNEIVISRARRDEFISGGLINYRSLREGESNSTLPTIVADGIYERRYFPVVTGGEFRFTANAHAHVRYSDEDIVGRDVSRLNFEAEWLRAWTLRGGVRADATIGAAADMFNVTQDSLTQQNQTQFFPFASLGLSYPMTRQEAGGATQYLEPIAQVAWTGGSGLTNPNEESTRVEFDGGNLVSLSRFPAPDRRERETVGAMGINWARIDPTGWESSVTFGHVIRETADADFTTSSGLSGKTSDFLMAGQIKALGGLSVTGRTLFDESFDFTKTEVRGQFSNKRASLAGTYLWLTEDPAEDRFDDVSEVWLDGSYRVADNWTASADWRYDVSLSRAARIGVGMRYDNECVSVDFSVKRRYDTSSSLEPSTRIGLTIGLRGFSARKGTETYSRTCG